MRLKLPGLETFVEGFHESDPHTRYGLRVRRRLSRMIAIAIAIGILAALGVGLLQRSAASDLESKAANAAGPLLSALPARYDQLGALLKAVRDLSSDRSVIVSGTSALTQWNDLAGASDADGIRRAIEAANDVETVIDRAKVAIFASPRLATAETVVAAIGTLDGAAPSEEIVDRYNTAVAKYQDQRTGIYRGLVARVFGIEAMPQFLLSGTPVTPATPDAPAE